jgi:CRP/FNR family transcriptional regulator, anaerobic regulatory protein
MKNSPTDLRMPEIVELSEALPRPHKGGSPCAACAVRDLALCSALENDELVLLDEIIKFVDLAAGDALFDEGEPAANVYNLTSGTIKLYKLLPDGRRQVTGFLFAGDFLGLAASEDYIYSAEAVTPVSLCKFSRNDLDSLIERAPQMGRRLLGMARHELAEAQEQILLLGRKTAKERIASFILKLSERAVHRGEIGDPVSIPMSRNDIGDYLGLTTETVSRTLTRLRSSGVIVMESDRKVSLAERETLQDIAEGF